MATVDDKKIIFSMVGVSKIIPQNRKQILKDIYLSFFYGAKIGIIGLNGAGKSTLMKIIAVRRSEQRNGARMAAFGGLPGADRALGRSRRAFGVWGGGHYAGR